jgi:serine/threonine protein kinase
VHGDLKSKNIFLVYRSPRERESKLLDFGVSRAAVAEKLYECAVGVNPFEASTEADTVRRIMNGEYATLSRHEARPSEPLVRIIERAMSLDPANRFSDVKALGRALLGLAGERTRMTWALSFGEPRGLPASRRPPPPSTGFLERLRWRFPHDFDWSSAAAIAFGLITFAWGVAILLSR